MTHPAGEAETGDLRVDFDRRLRLEFHGSRITSDAGLLAFRELDDALGLTGMAGDALADSRTGRNSRHSLMAQFRQSVFGRLAGYEDVNDADRLGADPAMRWIVGGQAVMGQAASTSQMGRFETDVLAKEDNVTALADLERCSLHSGNVHSADGWRDVLEPVVARYSGDAIKPRFFRGDAAFALPDLYDFLEAEGYNYAIRLKANPALQRHIASLLKRPVGRPPSHVRRLYASFRYQAGSWSRKRRVVAKVEWHPGELYPRVGFIVTNLARGADRDVVFYNQRDTAEQYIKEGKNAVKWTRLSCRTMRGNAVRLQLHAIAYNLANFLRTLALPQEVQHWSLTNIRDKLVKIGAKLVADARYATFQMAEVAVPRDLFRRILANIADLRCRAPTPCRPQALSPASAPTGKLRPIPVKITLFALGEQPNCLIAASILRFARCSAKKRLQTAAYRPKVAPSQAFPGVHLGNLG